MARSTPKTITVTITKWEQMNPRKDYKKPWWFALCNDLVEDPDFYDFTHGEFKAWIYIMSQASKKVSPTVTLNLAHADRASNIDSGEMLSAIEKLRAIGALEADVQEPNEICTDPVRDPFATEHNNTEQNNTIQDPPDEPSGLTPQGLFNLWNTHRGTLPECEKLSDDRKKKAKAQIKKYPDAAHWELALRKFTESEFCVNEWRPGFDDWLSESKRIRAIEGRYSNRGGPAPPGGTDPAGEAAARILAAIKRTPLGDPEAMQAAMSEFDWAIYAKAGYRSRLGNLAPQDFNKAIRVAYAQVKGA